MRTRRDILTSGLAAGALTLGACAGYQRDEQMVQATVRGDFGGARFAAQQQAVTDPGDRRYMLDQYKALIMTLAEGIPDSAAAQADRVYQMLRTQGLNDDKTVPSFFFGEGGVRIWKGEPFEQAMGYVYVGLFEAARGQWGNARAAANNSLFLLRDFSGALHARGEVGSVEDRERLIEMAAKSDRAGDAPDSFPVDYRPVASDFELGYALKAISARALGERGEAREACAQLVQVAPHLRSLASQIEGGAFNAVLVVDFGIGPAKIATGPDGAIAMFRPSTRSDNDPLVVRVGASEAGFPVVTDLNRLARDLKWNNLEDLRVAKSTIGTVLVTGGLMTAAVTANDKNPTAALIGLGVAGIGALMKATSAADTRHCEVLPQRVYIALLNLPPGDSTVDLSVRAFGVQMNMPAMMPPASNGGGGVQLRYVRLPDVRSGWATSGRVEYICDAMGERVGPSTPYILGGRDVRTPTPAVMQDYYDAGLPRSITTGDLSSMYREEGIIIVANNPTGPFGRHILEGGDALYSPQAGTTGFVRLMCQGHAPYQPKTARVRALAEVMGRRP